MIFNTLRNQAKDKNRSAKNASSRIDITPRDVLKIILEEIINLYTFYISQGLILVKIFVPDLGMDIKNIIKTIWQVW